ncbi:MAG: hypothetical protein ACETWR_03180 [Anaerolineae bacterium]
MKKLGFEILPGRGKGSHTVWAKAVVCKDGESHTLKIVMPAYKRELHPDTLAVICARTGLTPQKLKLAAKGKYTREQYERDLLEIPQIDLLSPAQRTAYLKRH